MLLDVWMGLRDDELDQADAPALQGGSEGEAEVGFRWLKRRLIVGFGEFGEKTDD